jgi:hypothetical protein
MSSARSNSTGRSGFPTHPRTDAPVQIASIDVCRHRGIAGYKSADDGSAVARFGLSVRSVDCEPAPIHPSLARSRDDQSCSRGRATRGGQAPAFSLQIAR